MKPIAEQLETCVYCPKMCRHTCPVSDVTGRESWTPGAKMAAIADVVAARQPWTHATTEAAWACTGCHACTMACELGVQPGAVLLSARTELTRRDLVPPRIADYPTRFRLREDRLVEQLETQFGSATWASDGPIGLFPGCDSIGKGARSIAALLVIAEAAGASLPLVMASRACVGYPLLAAGLPDAFVGQGRKVAAAWRDFSAIVVNCSACVATARVEWPRANIVAPRIISVPEYLAELAPRLPVPTKRERVFYHDPCTAARVDNVSAAARAALAHVADVREFTWHHAEADCCGGAGLLPKTMPQVADGMARHRLSDVVAKGGGIVVTSCGTCSFMLHRNASSEVTVLDLPVAVATLAGLDVPEPPLAADDDD